MTLATRLAPLVQGLATMSIRFEHPRRARPVLVLLAFVLAGCAVNPATGRRELSLIGEGQEIEMGREADAQIVGSLGLYEDEALQAYVRDLGLRLAARSERPDLPWTFRVVDDPTVNAFALPGGFIYVTRGILAHLTSEAQLVGVLGHEIGHVTARHSVSRMSRQQLAQLGLGVGMILSEDVRSVGNLAGAGLQLLSLRFGRADESQADELGIRYMRRTGHDPRELASVMRMLGRTGEVYGGGGRVPEWLSTHPDPANRVETIAAILAASPVDLEGATVGRLAYLRRLDGLVFGADPREGYFEGRRFHHPELRFRIDFPEGWTTANQKSAVQAVSPEEDAGMVLTVVEGSPEEAFADFAVQEGLSVGSPRADWVGGLPSRGADFTAATESGRLAGVAVFVRHRSATYRLLAYGPLDLWARRRAAAVAAVASFAEETDPSVLAVQPDRLDLVTLRAPITLSAFLERYPSAAPAPVVSLLNQLDGDVLPADVPAKRVLGN